jgi:hypothetical protein
MTCPYLKEVSMVFCRAYPVKKPVPIDRITTASTCEGDGFRECSLFREALARGERSATDETRPPAGPKGETP